MEAVLASIKGFTFVAFGTTYTSGDIYLLALALAAVSPAVYMQYVHWFRK
jgi:hypothetical protein